MNVRNVKICVIGDDTTDKTVFLNRFARSDFKSDYMKTVGAKFYYAAVKSKDDENHLYIFELTNNSFFKNLIKQYEEGAQCFMYFFDISREGTLDFLRDKVVAGQYNVLVGCKKSKDFVIPEKTINDFIKDYNINDYFTTEVNSLEDTLLLQQICDKVKANWIKK
ncbi:Ras family protein [Candidatus Tiddalikarchaeum anstoanum]|nr:Ras family protein [Candidatus Tiddalikarchaeum anstoanum]